MYFLTPKLLFMFSKKKKRVSQFCLAFSVFKTPHNRAQENFHSILAGEKQAGPALTVSPSSLAAANSGDAVVAAIAIFFRWEEIRWVG